MRNDLNKFVELLIMHQGQSHLTHETITFGNFKLKCLIDTGSQKSFINLEEAKKNFSKFIQK